MDDLDLLVEKIVAIKIKAYDVMLEKHPHIFSAISMFLSKHDNKSGIQITENGKVIGEYTIVFNGMNIKEIQNGVLSPEIQHPFGVIKPYGIVEKSVLERMIEDEDSIINDPMSTLRKYMPDITIKFMK